MMDWLISRPTDQYIAFFTLLTLGAITAQWLAMRRANQHFHASERAYVKLSHRAPGVDWLSNTSCVVRLRVKNFGATPADVTDVLMAHRVVSANGDLPEEPPYGSGEPDRMPEQFFLVKDDEFTTSEVFEVTPQERADINGATSLLLVFGYVDYIDKFGSRHRGGYARMYDYAIDQTRPPIISHDDYARRNNLPNFPHRAYNYDRLRKPSEGNDWPD